MHSAASDLEAAPVEEAGEAVRARQRFERASIAAHAPDQRRDHEAAADFSEPAAPQVGSEPFSIQSVSSGTGTRRTADQRADPPSSADAVAGPSAPSGKSRRVGLRERPNASLALETRPRRRPAPSAFERRDLSPTDVHGNLPAEVSVRPGARVYQSRRSKGGKACESPCCSRQQGADLRSSVAAAGGRELSCLSLSAVSISTMASSRSQRRLTIARQALALRLLIGRSSASPGTATWLSSASSSASFATAGERNDDRLPGPEGSPGRCPRRQAPTARIARRRLAQERTTRPAWVY